MATGDEATVRADALDWAQALTTPHERDAAATQLHPALLRIARAEIARRNSSLALRGPELDDLAHQAADDALVAILAKVGEFRGESRFTTWAYKFVIFEVARKVARHAWQRPQPRLDDAAWAEVPARFGADPGEVAEARDLVTVLRRAVQTDLSAHQQRVFRALVIDGQPLDALVDELGTNRNAVYKTMFDARRKLRRTLAASGYLVALDGRP